MYVCIYVQIHIHIYIYTYIYIAMTTSDNGCRKLLSLHPRNGKALPVYIHIRVSMYIYIYPNKNMYMQIHTCIYTYV